MITKEIIKRLITSHEEVESEIVEEIYYINFNSSLKEMTFDNIVKLLETSSDRNEKLLLILSVIDRGFLDNDYSLRKVFRDNYGDLFKEILFIYNKTI